MLTSDWYQMVATGGLSRTGGILYAGRVIRLHLSWSDHLDIMRSVCLKLTLAGCKPALQRTLQINVVAPLAGMGRKEDG
jgi:hypothetical protein